MRKAWTKGWQLACAGVVKLRHMHKRERIVNIFPVYNCVNCGWHCAGLQWKINQKPNVCISTWAIGSSHKEQQRICWHRQIVLLASSAWISRDAALLLFCMNPWPDQCYSWSGSQTFLGHKTFCWFSLSVTTLVELFILVTECHDLEMHHDGSFWHQMFWSQSTRGSDALI